MHVKDLHVTRYGPMTPFQCDGLGAFTVLYGPNEQGKTLLIDALLKLLFKKELKRTVERRFGNMKRVGEQPEGYVVLRTHADEFKLENDDTINTCGLPTGAAGLDPDDFRNVFVVRDSDLQVVDERDYYGRITERLTGLRSSEVEALLKIVRDKGRLRSVSTDSALANRADDGKIADRVRAARQLAKEIRAARDELAFGRYDELADELEETRRERRALADERDRVRVAEKRGQAARAQKALSELERLDAELAAMRGLDREVLKNWRTLAFEGEHMEKDVARDEARAQQLSDDLARAEEDLRERRAEADEVERRFHDVERELAGRIEEFQRERSGQGRTDLMPGATRRTLGATAVLVALALVAYTVRPSAIIAVVGALALAALAVQGWVLLRHRRREAHLGRRAAQLLASAARLGIRVEGVLDLQSAIGEMEREVQSRRDAGRERESRVARVRDEIAAHTDRLAAKRARLSEIGVETASIRASAGCASADEYQAAVDRRTALEASRRATRDLIASLVPVEPGGGDELSRWREAVEKALAAGGDDALEAAAGDPERGAELDRRVRELEAREGDMAGRLGSGGKRLYNLQMKAADLKVLDEVPRCRTLNDLDHVASGIDAFCDDVEHRQALAQQVTGVFLEIDAEERARVGELFGPAAQVSTLFREITDGRYRTVTYDTEQDQVLVEPAAGKPIRASALSGGAIDQLYLAIRFCIAERLLPTSKGFFILDDPFIKADAHRLYNLMNTLRRFVRSGWQILYFTAKKEVLDGLASDIEAGEVRLVEFDRNLFSQTVWNESRGAHSGTT